MPYDTEDPEMADIFSDTIFKCILLNEKFYSWGQICSKTALVHEMAWCQTGAKPLTEPMLIKLHVAVCCH